MTAWCLISLFAYFAVLCYNAIVCAFFVSACCAPCCVSDVTAQVGRYQRQEPEAGLSPCSNDKLNNTLRYVFLNLLTPNDHHSGRTAPLTSKRFILYIYSTNIGTEYFKHCIYSPFFFLQNAVCLIILTYLVPALFTFYIQGVLKLKK